MQAFQKEITLFEKLDAQVLGVSSDTLATHEEFAREHGFTFPLLADEKGALQKLYGAGRATFVVDKTGVVRHVQRGFPDTGKLLKLLSTLQADQS
jgi:peroxiredoxin Q/BCP